MLAFELVSPERLLLAVEAAMVSLPGAEGDMGILPGHAPMIATLRPGVIEVGGSESGAERIFVAGGVLEVARDKLVVLADEAIPVAELDSAGLEQRIQDAREDIEDAKDDEARLKAQSRLRHLEDLLAAIG